MPDFTHANWLAVIIAAVAAMVIGYIWYMPAVSGSCLRQQVMTGS